MFNHTDLARDEEVKQCLSRRSVPINPYKMRDGRGIDFALRACELLDAPMDAGVSGGCIFVMISRDTDPEAVKTILDLRDQEYRLYNVEQGA